MVSVPEAEAVAEKLGTLYQETSAQTGEHVDKAFDSDLKIGHAHRAKTGDQEDRKSLRTLNSWLAPISMACTNQ